ncbi:MAG: tetratricopeptide repeat protein, partial [Rhodospirillaceae bacterium]|nr:tetratricopeptide repeat protein [Rhodospirillaceae bacterium]
AARVGKLPEAEKQGEQTKDSADPKVRARTLYELTLVQLKAGSITPAKAIERLEEARFLWRGGPLELTVTRRLADLYLQQGEARKGLSLLRAAAAEFADSPEAPAIAQRMTQAFEDLYLNGGADRLKPLSAVALFQEFRELMPAGEKGDRMIAALADRMVKVDLLDQAAALLEDQVKTRLQGVERARVGARLAAIRLLDRKPDAALEALKLSDGADLPGQLAAERRRLEARARLEKGQGDVALALIAGDDSPDGLLLRVDIAWRAQKWADAAAAIGALVEARGEDPAKLSAEGEQLVLNRAVALSLAADHDGLKALRDRFGDSMGAGPFADAFALLTSDFAEADALKPVAEQLKGVEQVEGFLAAYRKRLQLASLSDQATTRPVPAP